MASHALARPSASGIDRLRQQFAPKATDEDLGYFAEVCRHLEVDPWAGHICLIGWTDGATGELIHRPTLTVAGRRFIAERTGRLRGIDGPMWCGPRAVRTGAPLEWLEVWDGEGPPYAARCLVYVDGWDRPANGTVKWSEFAQKTRRGDLTRNWAAMPSHMLGKTAESLALRRAFAEVQSAVAYLEADDDDTTMVREVAAEAFVEQIAPPAPPDGTPGQSPAPAAEEVTQPPAAGAGRSPERSGSAGTSTPRPREGGPSSDQPDWVREAPR